MATDVDYGLNLVSSTEPLIVLPKTSLSYHYVNPRLSTQPVGWANHINPVDHWWRPIAIANSIQLHVL